MGLYQPTELLSLLKQLNKLPKKGLSQNFLIDGNILKKIIKIAEICENDQVLEIGPGPGALTLALLESKAKVTAIEKDFVFASYLQSLNLPHLKVIEADFLKIDLPDTFKKPLQEASLPHKIKVVANLPYNITTPILFKLLENHLLFSTLTIMVQREVAERIVAAPKTKAYSSLSIFIKTYADPKLAFIVSPSSFYPKPKVESAILFLSLKPPLLKQADLKKWHQFVHTAFQQRRKKITSSLAKLFEKEKIIKALDLLKLNPNSRPEELSIEEFLKLFQTVSF